MEIKIMRHNRGAENADCDVKHVPVAHDLSVRKKTAKHIAEFRVRENNLKKKTAADDERNFKKQIQGNGRTDHFGEIAGANRQFAKNPEPQCNWLRIMIVTRLGKVPLRSNSQPRAMRLEQDRH